MNPVSEVYQFANVVTAGTSQAAPLVFPMQLPYMDVAWIEWIVPPGPGGDVGFWIGSHGQQIIPFASGAPNWIVTDDERAHWDMTGLMDSGDWQMVAYNVGVNDHTVTVRFGLTLRPPPVPGPGVLLPASSLTGQI